MNRVPTLNPMPVPTAGSPRLPTLSTRWLAARAPQVLRRLGVLLCAALLLHCGVPAEVDESDPTGATTESAQQELDVYAGTIRSISVSPAAPTVAKGGTLQFTATATYTDGSTEDVTKMAAWSVKDLSGSGVATIDTTGLMTANTVGRATISARYKARSSSTQVTVTAPALSSIVIAPADPSIPKGGTVRFAASGVFSDGSTADITRDVTWAVADLMGTRVASIDGTGTATGVSVGQATVSAEYLSLTAETTLTVGAALPASLSISPANASIAKGTSQVYKATLTLSDGSTQDATNMATWTVSDRTGSGVALISSMGVARGLSTGTATVTATYMGHSSSAGLTVTAAVLASLAINPTSATVVKGGSLALKALGTYTDGSQSDLSSAATWTVTDVMGTGVATVDAVGKVSGKNLGSAKITASIGTISGSASIDVVVPTYTKLVVSGLPGTIQGIPTPYTATATLSDGSTVDVTSRCTWSVKDVPPFSGVATIDSKGVLTGKASGFVEVHASFMGLSSSVSVLVL